MKKDEMVAAINNAIENQNEVTVTIDTDCANGILFSSVPTGTDIGDETIIVYFGASFVTLDVNNIEENDMDSDAFDCSSEASTLTISF